MFIVQLLLVTTAVLLEGTVTTLPLALVVLFCTWIFRRVVFTFFVAFTAGFFIDILLVHRLGVSSLFFITFLFLASLYKRKYEIDSTPFVLVAAFLGAMIYLSLFGFEHIFFQSIVSSLLAVFLFTIMRLFHTSEKKDYVVPAKMGVYKH